MYAQIWSEDFETDGNNLRYFAAGQFNDVAGAGNDHYGRTQAGTISNVSGAYTGQSGTWFFAGEDINDTGDPNADGQNPKILLFAPIDVSGLAQIELRALIATGNVAGGWDNTDVFYFEYNLDGGGWVKVMQFAAPIADVNIGMNFDADLDGVGEGALITTVFAPFSATISGSGNMLELRVVTGADAGSEEFALDLVSIWDGADGPVLGCMNPNADNYNPAATMDDGSCIFAGCTDPLALNYSAEANSNDGSCIYVLPAVVINEIHYNPCAIQGEDFDYEFLELYNAGDVPMDISGWTLSNAVTFTFPAGSLIEVGEYIIVCANAASYLGNGYQVFQWISGNSLNNTGETITLSTADPLVVDEVTYSDFAPWPTAPDGACPSLEIIDPLLDNSLADNWQASFEGFGTPGAPNTIHPPVTPYSIVGLQTEATAGEYISTVGIVTAVYPALNLLTVQSGLGAYTGIWVEGTGVALGDEVSVEGSLAEELNLTIISAAIININSSNNPLPEPLLLGTLPANLEAWEGVLIKVTAPVVNGDLGLGEWAVSDGTGAIIIDDMGLLFTPVQEGPTYTIVGPLYDAGSAFKIEPRGVNDLTLWGCTDEMACNFLEAAEIDDYSCDYNCIGCTEVNAANYSALATIDDGSCLFPGCTYPNASNYDVNANEEDGSCIFESLCPSDLNGDALVNAADLLLLLAAFGTVCP